GREGWMGLQRGHKAKPLEWLAERLIFAVSLSAILMVFLIFVFIGREALPVILGRVNNGRTGKALSVEQMEKMGEKELEAYLEITPEQHKAMDHDTLKTLMELKLESASTDKDAAVNSLSWPYLIKAHQWTGY